MSSPQPAAVSPKVLKCFWDLTDADQGARWGAIRRLLSAAVASQAKGDAVNDPSELCPLMKYCLHRFFRGLASSVTRRRESCSVGLGCLLQAIPCIQAPEFLDLMETDLPLKTESKTAAVSRGVADPLRCWMQVSGDVLIGRAMAHALLLGLSYDLTAQEVLLAVVKDVMALYDRPNLSEICAVHLSEIFDRCGQADVRHVVSGCPGLLEVFQKAASAATAEDVFVCLKLWKIVPAKLLESCNILPQVPLVEVSDFDQVASGLFFEESHLSKFASALQNTTENHPELHSVWDALISLLLCDMSLPKVQVFWERLIDPLSASAAPKQFLAMKISLRILPQLTPLHIPSIVRGPPIFDSDPSERSGAGAYWQRVAAVAHAEKEPLHGCAAECFKQLSSLFAQTIDASSGWIRVLLLCRLPTRLTFQSLRADLSDAVSLESAVEYAEALMKEFLNPGAGTSICCEGLRPQVLLHDLQCLAKLGLLSEEITHEVVLFLVFTGLFTCEKKTSAKNPRLAASRKATVELTQDLRHRSVCCLISLYESLNRSVLSDQAAEISPLGMALKLGILKGVKLARAVGEEETEVIAKLHDVAEFLEMQLKEGKSEKQKKQIRALHDLICVVRVYYFANAETVSPSVLEDLSHVVALLYGSAQDDSAESSDSEMHEIQSSEASGEDEMIDIEAEEGEDTTSSEDEESEMDELVTLLIELCVRQTEPLSIRLMTKYVRRTLVAFAEDVTLSAWVKLLSLLSNPAGLDIEQEGQESSPPPVEETESSGDEDETSIQDSVEELNDMFDASILADDDEPKESSGGKRTKKVLEDIDRASARVLVLVDDMVKESPKNRITFLIPIYLMKAVLNRERAELEKGTRQVEIGQKLQHVLAASLSCKPELAEEDLPHIRDAIAALLEEIAKRTSHQREIFKTVGYCIRRLKSSSDRAGYEGVLTEILRTLISLQFAKRPCALTGQQMAALLRDNREFSPHVLSHLISCGTSAKPVLQKIKALEFLHVCLNGKETQRVKEALKETGLDHFLMEMLEIQLTGRVQVDLLQQLSRVVNSIKKISGEEMTMLLSLDKMHGVVQQRLEAQNPSKIKRKWKVLSQALPSKKLRHSAIRA